MVPFVLFTDLISSAGTNVSQSVQDDNSEEDDSENASSSEEEENDDQFVPIDDREEEGVSMMRSLQDISSGYENLSALYPPFQQISEFCSTISPSIDFCVHFLLSIRFSRVFLIFFWVVVVVVLCLEWMNNSKNPLSDFFPHPNLFDLEM